MNKRIQIILLFCAFTGFWAKAQKYVVERAPFSSRITDEFSPVYYRDGLVFCSNMRDNSLINFTNESNRLFKIFFVRGKSGAGWGLPVLLSKDITSGFNDGPATFSHDGEMMYFSRNNSVVRSLGNITDPDNKLGIFSSELSSGAWTNVRPFEYNNPAYSLSSPSLSPDEDRLYFSSDMPGGFGGMDIYYCEKILGDWQKPVNLGPLINTPGNETFPFSCPYRKIYFSSDGHQGLGGKDLFYSQEIDGSWIPPVHLDSAINSPADDFGIVIDTTYESGYFSSRRYNTDDIFSFRVAPLEFTSCDSIKENYYCYTFYDEKHTEIDSIPVTYVWDFGEGDLFGGPEIKHCFSGPGNYEVRLIVTDQLTGDTISERASYLVNLKEKEQVFIRSSKVGLVEDTFRFEALNHISNYNITDYLWDFGKGFEPGGQVMEKRYSKDGDYFVRLGLLGRKDGEEIQKCYIKNIKVISTAREMQDGSSLSMTEGQWNIPVRVFYGDGLSEKQRSRIRTYLNAAGGMGVSFNKYGIMSNSFALMTGVYKILRDDPAILLQVKVHPNHERSAVQNPGIAERWSQELSFYFRNIGVRTDAVKCTAYDTYFSGFRPEEKSAGKSDGVIEFIFYED